MRTIFMLLFVSLSACAVAEGNTQSSLTTHTVQVPVVATMDAAPGSAIVATVSPTSWHYVRLPVDAGQTITAVSARVQDTVGTRLRFAIATTHDGAPVPQVFTTSTLSAGDGTEQTIMDTAFLVPGPASGQQWFAIFQVASGTGSGSAIHMDMDVTP